jgi:hypothetical protein
MAGPSASCVLKEHEQVQVLNEVLNNENTGEFSLDDDSIFDNDYMQLMTPGTHVISHSESDNGRGEQQEERCKISFCDNI